MVSYKTLQRWNGLQIRFAVTTFAVLFAGLFALTIDTPSQAAQTLPTKMNFQGRIANNSGTILPNGTYNMRFKIWNLATGGVQQWSEDRLIGAGNGVTITNGQFSVQLGSVSALNASVFSSNSLYFEVELPTPASATTTSPVWTEGAMTPRNQLATSAYAYNAETLDGIDSDAFAKIGTANAFIGANTFSGTSGFTNTVDINSSSTNAFQVRNGSANLFSVNAAGTQVNVGVSDVTATTLVLDTRTAAGDPSGTNGAMYYNSNAAHFRCYENGAWRDCIVDTTMGALDGGAANATGATLSSSTLFLQSASLLNPGLVNTTTQSFAGDKTFTGVSTMLRPSTDSEDTFNVTRADGTTQLFAIDGETGVDPLEVQIGTNTTLDAVQINLALDSSTQYTDQGTCGTSSNQGSMYYNTSTSTVRMCVNGVWEDMVSTGGLGLMAFGVVPDSSNAGSIGDIAGITQANSPCKVRWASATQVTVAPCYAYSGGRRITVPSTTLSTTGAANTFVNVCLSGANGAPALVGTANAADNASPKPTWSANNPILCLATLQISGTTNTISNGKIYDIRTFTTSSKTYATSNTNLSLGTIVSQTGTANIVAPTAAAAAAGIRGVVVAYSGATSTTVANSIIATEGPVYVKAVGTSAVNSFVQATTTSGYSGTAAISTVGYANMGVATRTIDTTCSSVSTCQYSQFLNPMAIR